MTVPTRQERDVVTYRLRKAAERSYVWLDDKTLREITGMKPSGLDSGSTLRECIDSTREIFRRLADLIDPEGDEDDTD